MSHLRLSASAGVSTVAGKTPTTVNIDFGIPLRINKVTTAITMATGSYMHSNQSSCDTSHAAPAGSVALLVWESLSPRLPPTDQEAIVHRQAPGQIDTHTHVWNAANIICKRQARRHTETSAYGCKANHNSTPLSESQRCCYLGGCFNTLAANTECLACRPTNMAAHL